MAEKLKISAELEYCGPPDAESPLFGPLVRGARYVVPQAVGDLTPAAFAEYLVTTHPEHWRRPGRVMPSVPVPGGQE